MGGRASAQAAKARIKFALVGINHEHVFRMVRAVRSGGGELAMVLAEDADPNHAAKFFRENPDVRRARNEREILDAKDISLVVSAIRPADRAALGVRVMRAGKDFMADKGGVLSLEQLNEVERVQAETKRIYSISYNEHLLDLGTVEALRLVRAGAVGKVTRTVGVGPHALFGHGPREPWFWTRAGRGGIFADIGTHQCCDFLLFTVPGAKLEVLAARAGNRENPQYPEFEDFGAADVRGNGGAGRFEVSFVKKSSPRTLRIEGAEGRLEIVKGGEASGKLTLVDKRGTRAVDLKQTVVTYGQRLVDDVLNRTETAMEQSQTFLATELALRAQEAANRNGNP